ncbi:energy-coupling factor transporter ATPase [Oenococcus alcoholitolerans]|uniref:energy-coupling factor transporter ATPase n=1 Tax=Oenococcus alcoholitolerans TaxID=931074 RepID=UPI003F6ED81E
MISSINEYRALYCYIGKMESGTNKNLLVVKNVSFRYSKNGKWILKDISIDFKKGQFTVILGANGSGKSTFARHLNGLLLPVKGDIWANGINTKDAEKKVLLKEIVGLIFQNPDNQLVSTIVQEDTAFGPENLGLDQVEIRKRVFDSLKSVGMYDQRYRSTFKLSGGQKQRLAIAGILALRPKVIVLDEATSMLDPQGRRDLIELLFKLKKQGMTIILITHHMEEAELADRVVILEKGRIAADGKAGKVFSDPEMLKRNGLELSPSRQLLFSLKQINFTIDDQNLDGSLDWQKAVSVILKKIEE